MINRHAIEKGRFISAQEGKKVAWIEVIQATDEEIQFLLDEYHLPEDYLSDVNDPNEVPRFEGLDDPRPNLFVLSYPVHVEDLTYVTRVVSIIVIDDFVVTVRSDDSLIFRDLHLNDFTKTIEKGHIENFVLEITWRISKEFERAITEFMDAIEIIQNNIRRSTHTDSLYEMIEINKSLIHFQSAIEENNHVLKSMVEMEYLSNSTAREDLMHDLLIENKQAQIMIRKSMDLVSHLSSMYSNVINNNLNIIMKVLTSLTIVMTVPTIISGFWGMNVDLPMMENPNAFWHLLWITIVISLLLVLILRRRDYI